MALKEKEKKMLKILGVVFVLAGAYLYKIYHPKKSDPVVVEEKAPEEKKKETSKKQPSKGSSSKSKKGGGGKKSRGGAASSLSSSISVENFKKHNTVASCWVNIEGEIYDITGFISKYPTQQSSVEQFCGTFGFDAGFNGESSVKKMIKATSQKKGSIG